MLCRLRTIEAERTESSALFLHPPSYPQSCAALGHLVFPWKSQGPKANAQATVLRNRQRPGREVPRGEHTPCTGRRQHPLPGECGGGGGGAAQRCFGARGAASGPSSPPGGPWLRRAGPERGPGPSARFPTPRSLPPPRAPSPNWSWLRARVPAAGAGFGEPGPAAAPGPREHVARRGGTNGPSVPNSRHSPAPAPWPGRGQWRRRRVPPRANGRRGGRGHRGL